MVRMQIQSNGTDPQEPQTKPSQSTTIRVVGVGLSAVAFNWLSGLWAPAAPIVIILAVVSLGLISISDSARFENSPSLSWISSLKKGGLLELGLAALVLGAVIAALWLLPIYPTERFILHIPEPFVGLGLEFGGARNYEFGAIGTIVALTALAAYRAPSLRRQATFLAAASFGTAVAFTYLRQDENSFLITFVGTLVVASLASVIVATLPQMFQVLLSFWGISMAGRRRSAAASASISDPPPTVPAPIPSDPPVVMAPESEPIDRP